MALSQGWINTVKDGLTNRDWDAYDSVILAEVGLCDGSAVASSYNFRFKSTQGYACVDWQLFKCMLWVESGGPKQAAWTKRPFQIGNAGDPAYSVLKSASEGSSAIMSPELAKDVKSKSMDSPELNVKAGIAYLFTRMAKFDNQSILDPNDSTIYNEVVRHGDSFSSIAKRVGTTVKVLEQMQDDVSASAIKVGQKLQYRKAHMGLVILGWRSWDFTTIAARYNGGGDPSYAEKLQHVQGLLNTLAKK
jgi:LysM repeat protein